MRPPRRRVDSLGRKVGHLDPTSPGYRLAADAAQLRLVLEQARHGLTAALLNPDPSALRPRAQVIADLLNDLADELRNPRTVVLP